MSDAREELEAMFEAGNQSSGAGPDAQELEWDKAKALAQQSEILMPLGEANSGLEKTLSSKNTDRSAKVNTAELEKEDAYKQQAIESQLSSSDIVMASAPPSKKEKGVLERELREMLESPASCGPNPDELQWRQAAQKAVDDQCGLTSDPAPVNKSMKERGALNKELRQALESTGGTGPNEEQMKWDKYKQTATENAEDIGLTSAPVSKKERGSLEESMRGANELVSPGSKTELDWARYRQEAQTIEDAQATLLKKPLAGLEKIMATHNQGKASDATAAELAEDLYRAEAQASYSDILGAPKPKKR
eukprot:CAMPEP_0114552624 /NCGR_PEP_ID=MMETSP0114-20121206/7221_1 /TAXON_ID=31324 /ORGANISM="Goniomonas sp, Strain m" /LENGTH=305 /DNA_ID=CAMNT_0001737507 /DNA_START=55 /DNA_END=972 /DNA_ORIENTATION=+